MSRFREGSERFTPPPDSLPSPAGAEELDQDNNTPPAKGWRTAHNKVYAAAFLFVLVSYLSLAAQTLSIFLVATGTAFGFSSGVLFVATKWPIVLVYGGYIMSVLMLIASTALSVFLQIYIEAAINAACLALLALVAWRHWSRLRLAAVFIKTTTLIANDNKSVYVVVFVALIVSCLTNVLNVAGAIAVFLTFQPYHEGNHNHNARTLRLLRTVFYPVQHIPTDDYVGGSQSAGDFFKVILLLIAMFVAFSWIAATIDNIIVATLAGGPFSFPFANILCCCITNLLERLAQWFNKYVWYDLPIPSHLIIPSNLSALLIAITHDSIEIVRTTSDRALTVAAVRDFQQDYFDAAKQTLAFLKGANKHHQQNTRHLFPDGHEPRDPHETASTLMYISDYENGIGALINDVFTSSALHFGAFACALLCGIITFAYIEFANATSTDQLKSQYWECESRGDRTSPLQIEVVTDKILQEAGVSTIFVCIYDMEPEQYVLTSVHHPKTQNSCADGPASVDVVLANRAPELHELLIDKYQNAIGGRYQQPMGEKTFP
ncbi:hypothetical protein EHS25_004581 [Saitozyma podzolica]|uniref:Protein PNS1 n=1 Tax=Saitozyma podzolica TaxID=1890683 RepID=A0A427YUU6_9TREE|nr:hypothetical protein EHS25_004581 [Saitozyma podzolica]